MPDTNMTTANSWASELADLSQLTITIDINDRTQLISEINDVIGHYINYDYRFGGSGLFEHFSEGVKEILLNRIDDIVRHYDTHEKNEKCRKSIGLRLWSGCLSAAKVIALETRDGLNTPKVRGESFQYLDDIADRDSIFRAGVESAPLFKKYYQQCYSFNGVPPTSPVRRYPNDYLIDRRGEGGALMDRINNSEYN
jgi:hypothetical protein